MADNELTLTIKTKTDLAAAVAARAELEKGIGRAKALGKEYGEMQGQLERVNRGLADYTQRTGDTSYQEVKANVSKRESRELLRGLTEQFPALGEVGRIAFTGVVGAVVLFVNWIGNAMTAIQQLGNRSTPEIKRLTDAIEAQKDAIEAVDLAAAAYQRSLDRLAHTKITVQDAAKDNSEKLKSQADFETTMAQKSADKQSAILEAAEKMGLITHARKLLIDEDYAKKAVAIQNRLQFQEMKGKADERFAADMESRGLQKGLGAKRDAQKKADAAVEFTQGKKEQDADTIKNAEAKLKELNAEHDELMSKTTGWGKFSTTTPQFVLERQKSQNEQEQLDQQHIIQQARSAMDKDRKQAADAKDRAAAAKEDVDADQDRLRKDKERIADINRTLPQDVDKFHTDSARRGALAGVESDTRVAQAAGQMAQSVEKSGGSAVDAMKALHSAIVSQHSQVIQTINGTVQVMDQQTQPIQQVKRNVERLQQTTKSRIQDSYNQ